MLPIVKKLIYLIALALLVSRVVDFSSPEFEPLRSQWQGSFDHITQHEYYGGYVQPVHDKVIPLISDIQDTYLVPSFTKVSSTAVDTYQLYLAHYVALVQSKIAESPVHELWLEVRPTLTQWYDVISVYASQFSEISTKYTALALMKSSMAIKYAYSSTGVYGKLFVANSVAYSKQLKDACVAFYHGKLVPGSHIAVTEYLVPAAYSTKSYAIIAWAQTKEAYTTYLAPLVESHVTAHIYPVYKKYLKEYIDAVIDLVAKYYRQFRVHQALDLSKKYFTGSYDQLLKHLKQQEAANVLSSETAETVTPEDDAGTDFDTTYEEMGTPEAPETDTEETVDADTTEMESTEISTTPEPVGTDTAKDLEAKKADGDLAVTLAEEIGAWKTYIYESIDNIFSNFDESVSEIETTMIANFKPTLTQILRNLTETAEKDYQIVNKAIYNINSTTTTLENGQEVELDKNGNVIDHKVTREEFRELLADKREALKTIAEGINDKLRAFVSEVEDALGEERKLIVDIYEEFAEVAINEFSKKMMYSTFSSSFENMQNKNGNENFKDWKEYIKVKNDLIAKREELVNKETATVALKQMLKEVYMTLKALDNESNDFYNILRAKANIEFQEREAKEREAEAEARGEDEDDDDEPLTITSTIIKYKTLTADGSVETNDVEIESDLEEDVSDFEVEERDFEPEVEEGEDTVVVDAPQGVTISPEDLPEESAAADEAEPDTIEDIEPVEESTPDIEDVIEHGQQTDELEADIEESETGTPDDIAEHVEDPEWTTLEGVVEHEVEGDVLESEAAEGDVLSNDEIESEETVGEDEDVEEADGEEITTAVDTPQASFATAP